MTSYAPLPAEQALEQLSPTQLASLPIYEDPMQHVRDELKRLAILMDLRAAALKQRGVMDERAGRFQGLLLRDGELDRLLQQTIDPAEEDPQAPEIVRQRRAFEGMTRRITLREAATLWSVREGIGGCRLPLLEVSRRFGLDRLHYHILVLALAPEVELSFQRMFSHLLNDVTRKKPTVHLALSLFSEDDEGQRRGRAAFASDSPLLRFNLLHLDKGSGQLETSLLLREFKMPERVVQWLMGAAVLDPEMSRYAYLVQGQDGLEDLIYEVREHRRVKALAEYMRQPAEGPTPLVVLTGPRGVGKKTVASRLAAAQGRRLMVATLPGTAFSPAQREQQFRDLAREARLHDAALCLADFSEDLVKGGLLPGLPFLYQIMRMAPGMGVLTCETEDLTLGGAGAGFVTRARLEVPESYHRIPLWERLLEITGVQLDPEVDLRGFALKYGFTAGALARVLDHAREEAQVRSGDRAAPVSAEDLDLASRIQLGQGLSGVATRVRRTASWDDLILPEEILETLQEILRHAKFRNKVFHDWGFDRKMTSGKGLSILFSGPPGTGKTMVAGVLASELGMDLYKVDLSQIVSKYVGETEKNLSTVFQAAAGNQFIILFDEADSLFAKRTEVKSSVDRYANLEVNYLLQKMEEYSGICVLTTNFEKSIDDAFKRRLQFRLDFPFPEKEDRERLWRVHLPTEAPLEKELELEWLADHYELSGGNIKNAVLRAAFRAVEHGRPICVEDLEYAAERESRELGKLVQGPIF